MQVRKRLKKLLSLFFISSVSLTYAETPPAFFALKNSAIYDSVNKQILVFGTTEVRSQTYELFSFDIEKKLWKKIKINEENSPTITQYGCKTIYIEEKKQMLVFVNEPSAEFTSIWTFNIEKKSWDEIEAIETDDSPSTILTSSCIYDSNRKRVLFFGGTDMESISVSDLWAYDVEKKQWEKIKTKKRPPARFNHSAIYDSTEEKMFIFGGYGERRVFSDLWVFDIKKKTWEEIEVDEAPPFANATLIYDSVRKQMFIFGGFGLDKYSSDTWAFDVDKKTWKEIETDDVPPARTGHNAIYDPVNKQMLIFGGNNQNGFLSDMWVFNIESLSLQDSSNKFSLQDNSAKASLNKTWKKLKFKFEKE